MTDTASVKSWRRKVTDAPSVRMWHEYFRKAKIFGIDISDFKAFETEWFIFCQADCGDERRLEEVVTQLNEQPRGLHLEAHLLP